MSRLLEQLYIYQFHFQRCHYFLYIGQKLTVILLLKHKEVKQMATNRSGNSQSSGAFNRMKYEVANELGVTLNEGYNGNLTSRDAGRIGGTIVKKVFAEYRNKNQQ